jgi:hypothetical protein
VLSTDDFFVNLARKHVIRFGLGDPLTSTSSVVAVAALRRAVEDLGANVNPAELDVMLAHVAAPAAEGAGTGDVVDTRALIELASTAQQSGGDPDTATLGTGFGTPVVGAALHLTVSAARGGWEHALIAAARDAGFVDGVTVESDSFESLSAIRGACPTWTLLLTLRDAPLAASQLFESIASVADGVGAFRSAWHVGGIARAAVASTRALRRADSRLAVPSADATSPGSFSLSARC